MSRHGAEGSIALAVEGRNFVANLRDFCDKIEHECDSLQGEIMEEPLSNSITRPIDAKRSEMMNGMRLALNGVSNDIKQIRNTLGVERPLKDLNEDLREEKCKIDQKVGKLAAYLQDYGYEQENEPSLTATKTMSPSPQPSYSSIKQPRSKVVQPSYDAQSATHLEPDIQENQDSSGLANREKEAEGARPLEHLSLDGLASPAANQEPTQEACCDKPGPDTETSNENSPPVLSPVYNISLQDLSLSKTTLAALAGVSQEDPPHQQMDPEISTAIVPPEEEDTEISTERIQDLQRGEAYISESDLATLPRFLTRSITVDSLNKEVEFANKQLQKVPEGLSNEEFTKRGLGGGDIKRSRQILLTLVKLSVLMTHVNDSGDVVYKKFEQA